MNWLISLRQLPSMPIARKSDSALCSPTGLHKRHQAEGYSH